jgi:radical SAM superfamily enzyme YgiQ (UPF0313 family)
MKILFVLPEEIIKNKFSSFISWFTHKFVYGFGNSLAFPVLAALTPKDHEVELVVGGHNEIDYDQNFDLVGISTVTRYSPLAYEIAQEFRKRGSTVVLGGWHASAMPQEAKQYADSVVVGEAEENWPILINDLKNGKIKPFYYPKIPVDPKLFPHPRIDIYPKRIRTSVQATRGCPFDCEFCAINGFKFRNKYRMRPIKNVIKDIVDLPNKGFFFIDSSFTINTNYTKELFKVMRGLNKKFYAYGNGDILRKDKELLKLSQEAGCESWFIGLESISQSSLDDINKKTNRVDEYISTFKKIHDHGMSVMGSFIFGFDYDTIDVFDKTDDFIRKSELEMPIFQILTPFPGTTLFNRFYKEGRIITKDWSKYDLEQAVFKPKNMTKNELEQKFGEFIVKQYSISRNIFKSINSMKLGPKIFFQVASMNNSFLFESIKIKKRLELIQ